MNTRKNKKLYYLRAKWDNQGKVTLESLLREAHKTMLTTGDRIFASSPGEIKGAHVKDTEDRMFFHIASYVPGEPTSTIDKDRTAQRATITVEPAPDGKDFLDGDIFVLVKDNHVIICPSRARENVARNYFSSVLLKFDKKNEASSLELCKVANSNKLNMLEKEGVKEIILDTSLYEASLMQLNKKHEKVSTIKAVIAQQLMRIFAQDPTLSNISEIENLNISLSIKFDGQEGKKKHASPIFGDSGRKRLLKTSEKIIAEYEEDREDGFTIVTGSGNTITADQVRISDNSNIEAFGKSLSCSDAWDKLSNYFDRLKSNGVLSQ